MKAAEDIRYRVRALYKAPVIEDGLFNWSLRLSNDYGADALLFNSGDNPLLVGWRLTRGTRLISEGRISPTHNVEPGKSVVVPVKVDLSAYESGSYTMTFALVREGVTWYGLDDSSRTASADVVLPFSMNEARHFVRSSADGITTAANSKASIFASIVEQFDFRALFSDIKSKGIDFRTLSGQQGANARAEFVNSDLTDDPDLNNLFHYALYRSSQDRCPEHHGQLNCAEYVQSIQYLLSLNADYLPPIPDAFLSILNEDITRGVIGPHELTGAELHFLMQGDHKVDLSDRLDVGWWLIENIIVKSGLPETIIPHSLFSLMIETLPSEHPVRLSRYLRETLNRSNRNYSGVYGDDDTGVLASSLDILLRDATRPRIFGLLGSEVIDFWSRADRPHQSSNVAIAAWVFDPDRCMIEDADNIFESAEPQAWFDGRYAVKSRSLHFFSTITAGYGGAKKVRRARGRRIRKGNASDVELVGLKRSQTGLGKNFEMLADGLSGAGAKLTLFDSEARPDAEDIPGSQAIVFAQNAETIPELMVRHPRLDCSNAVKIGFFLWEYAKLSPHQYLGVELVDRIWSPSRFVHECFENHAPGKSRLVPKLIELPELKKDSERSSDFTVFTSFDTHSGVERKDPAKAIAAFLAAFPRETHKNVRMIVKLTVWTRSHWGDPHRQLDRIRGLASRDDRIKIVSGRIPFVDYMNLINNSDCVISTHRSEGFGYLMAQAMYYGIPVIATGYSGNMDFCTNENCYLIDHDIVDVRARELFLPIDGAQWADARLDSAVDNLRMAFEDQAGAKTRAKKAQRNIRAKYSREAFVEAIGDQLAEAGVKL